MASNDKSKMEIPIPPKAAMGDFVHRYNALLPDTHTGGQSAPRLKEEASVLLQSIVNDLNQSLAAKSAGGQYDYVLATRQIKRINAFVALKYGLPDAQWKAITEAMLEIALSDGITLPRQNSLLVALNKLLGKRRDLGLVTIAWRPIWQLLQSSYLSHVNCRARGAQAYTADHLRNLVKFARFASRYFPPSAVSEVVSSCTPSLSHTNTHAMFTSLAFLHIFLPSALSVSDLPEGTAAHWLRVWSWVDHCTEWDALWCGLFARMAHGDAIVDVAGYDARTGQPVGSGGAAGFPWGAHLPFFYSKLQSLLKVPVAGGQPVSKAFPYEAAALLSGILPDGVDAACKLLVRLMTVKLPPTLNAQFGDDAAPVVGASASVSSSSSSAEAPPRPGVGDASVMGHLERLLRALSSFFYPTSSDKRTWSTFLLKVCLHFGARVGREAGSLQAHAVLTSSGLQVPTAGGLASSMYEMGVGGTPAISKDLITRFVDLTLPLAVLGMYAQKGQSASVWETGMTLKCLSALAPARVTKEIVGMASVALDPGTVNQTHQAPNALYILSIMVQPLTFPVPHIAPSIADFLHLALPGVDPNDPSKTAATLAFFSSVTACIPLIDSDDHAAHASAAGNGSNGDADTVPLPAWHPASPSYTAIPVGAHISAGLPIQIQPGLASKQQYGLANRSVAPGAGRVTASGVGDVGPDGKPITVAMADDDEYNGGAGTGDDADMDRDDDVIGAAMKGNVEPSLRDLFVSAREAGPRLCDWALLLLDRIFRVLEALEKPQKKSAGKRKGSDLGSNLHTVFQGLFAQMSPTLLKQASDRVFGWISGVSCVDGVKDVARLLESLASADPVSILKKFVPYHVSSATAPGTSDKILEWHGRLLAGLVRQTGPALVPYCDQLSSVVRACYQSKEKDTRKAGGKLLRWMLSCLLSTYENEQRSHAASDFTSYSTMWRKWGQPYAWLQEANAGTGTSALRCPGVAPSWHVPSQSERDAALKIINEFMVGPMTRLNTFAATIATSSTSSSPTAAAAAAPTDASAAAPAATATGGVSASIKAESDRVTVDMQMLLSAFRGGVYALTDGSGYEGDDDVICVGTTGMALVFDYATGKAAYAKPGQTSVEAASAAAGVGSGQSLRHAITLSVQSVARGMGGHHDFSRDVKALSTAIKVAYRTVAARGPKMSKTVAARNNLRSYKRFYREPLEDAKVRQFCRILVTAASQRGVQLPSSTLSTEGGTHQTSRQYMVSRILMVLCRRVAEGLYAVPRALHYGRSPSAIGEVDSGSGNEEFVDADEGGDGMEVESASAEGDDAAVVAAAAAGGRASPDMRPVITFFGKRALSKLSAAEHPYALQLAALLQLALHPYDKVRHTALSHVATMLSIFGWLRKPAQLKALDRLDRLASLAVSSAASSRAAGLKAAAEAYLSAQGGSSASPKMPPGGIPPSVMAALKDSLSLGPPASGLPSASPSASPPPDARSESPSAVPPPGAPGVEAGVTPSTVGTAAAATAIPGAAAGVFFGGKAADPEATKAALLAAAGAAGIDVGKAAASLLSPSLSAVAAARAIPSIPAGAPAAVRAALSSAAGAAGAATPPLEHNEVLGLANIAFSGPAAMTADWQMFERGTSVLLRSQHILAGLPTEKHAEAMRSFSYHVIRVLYAWHQLPVDPNSKYATQQRATRDHILRFLLGSACPPALTSESDAPASSSSSSSSSAPLVLQADGSRGASAAPFPPSPLHWRYELLCGAFIATLLAPSKPAACRLAIDAASHVTGSDASSPRGYDLIDPTSDGRQLLAPEAVWLWALSNILSDNVFLRLQAMDLLVQLLHVHVEMKAGASINTPALTRVASLLSDRRYMSQFVAAVAQDHTEKHGGDEGGHGGMDALLNSSGMRELATPLECTRPFAEHSRHGLRGGAISSLPHMILFELMYLAFPQCLRPCLDALAQIGSESSATAAAKATPASPADAAASASEAGGDSNAAAAAGGDGKSKHELATLRNRQATVAEAFGGFMRAVSLAKAPGSHPAADKPGSHSSSPADGSVAFQPSDASVQTLIAEVGVAGAATAPGAGHEGIPTTAADLDANMLAILNTAAPILESVGLDWAPDWTNSIRYMARQRHPSQLAVLTRYVFANASNAVAGANVYVPSSYDSAGLESILSQISAGAATTATGKGAASSSATSSSSSAATSSFAAQTRWLQFVQALMFEFFATADGKGCSGSLPGVTCEEEEASECGLHASRRSLITRVPAAGQAHGIDEGTVGSKAIIPARQATAGLVRAILPVLLRSLGHSYKSCREEITRTIMVAVECGWCPADVGASSPVRLPTVQVRSADGSGWQDSGEPVLCEPVSAGWAEWVAPTVAAMLHMAAAAGKPSAAAAAGSGAAAADASSGSGEGDNGDVIMGGTSTKPASSAAPAASEDDKWGHRVLDSLLFFIYDAMGADTIVANPPLLPLVAVTLTAQNHPDREVSKLAASVMYQFAHTLTLGRANSTDAVFDTSFFSKVEGLLGSVGSKPAALSAAHSGSALGSSLPAHALGLPSSEVSSGCDIVVRLLEAYSAPEAEAATGGGDDAGEGAAAGKTPAGKEKKPQPGAGIRSPIVSAIQASGRGTAAGSEGGGAAAASSSSTSWFVRRAVLQMVTPMRARHLMVLTRAQDAALLQIVESRLDDKQIEVQEVASEGLIGFVMTMPTPQRRALADRLLALASTKVPKRVAAPADMTAATPAELDTYKKYKTRSARAIRKRHAGCLGVSSIVKAHPFDVPAYLPSVLASLAQHVSDPAPIASTVKKTVGEFRRTHQDNWEQHKMAFSEQELQDILSVTAGGNYFA